MNIEDTIIESRAPVETSPRSDHAVTLVCLLSVWVVFSVATVILVVALLLPGHLGCSDLLQTLSNVLPADFPIYTT
jgi:hypothetical protein